MIQQVQLTATLTQECTEQIDKILALDDEIKEARIVLKDLVVNNKDQLEKKDYAELIKHVKSQNPEEGTDWSSTNNPNEQVRKETIEQLIQFLETMRDHPQGTVPEITIIFQEAKSNNKHWCSRWGKTALISSLATIFSTTLWHYSDIMLSYLDHYFGIGNSATQ